MNQDQITGIIRAVVPAVLAYAVGRGWIGANSVGDVTTAIVTLVAAAWSIYTNSFSQKIQSVATSSEGIQAAKDTPITPATAAMADALKQEPK